MACVKKIAVYKAPDHKGRTDLRVKDLKLKDRQMFKDKFTRLKAISNDLLVTVDSPDGSSSRRASGSSGGSTAGGGGGTNDVRQLMEKKAMLTKLLQDLQFLEFKYLNGGSHHHELLNRFKYSRSVVDFLNCRTGGNTKLQSASLNNQFGLEHLLRNNNLNETNYKLDAINKVFCSQWLSDRQIVFGTKCNKIMLLDTLTGKMFMIPNLKSSSLRIPPENSCGIHSIEINPSRTLLATGGENANDIAIYKLPTLDPVCVGEGAHSDWTFDMAWLDDEFLVTGSRDSAVALWRVEENSVSETAKPFPTYHRMAPLSVKPCKDAEKIRAVIFNDKHLEIVALSLNAQLHLFDAQTIKQKQCHKLPFPLENVCLCQTSVHDLYAVGSKSHVSLLDRRTVKPASKIPSKYPGQGVRSINFCRDILTIGTGVGALLFYDIRAEKYLERTVGCEEQYVKLKATSGWVERDETFQDMNTEYHPAIYTHQYDTSCTRIFAAGGPLPANMKGHYAGLWS